MSEDVYSFEAYQKRHEIKKKRIKKLLFILALLTIIFTIIYFVFFAKYPLSYDEVGIDMWINENSIIVFSTQNASTEFTYHSTLKKDPYIVDLNQQKEYRDRTFHISASLWDRYFKKGKYTMIQGFTTEGVACTYMDEEWNFDNIKVGYKNENGNSVVLQQLTGRLYYDNPDGTTVLLWDFTEGEHE